MLFHLLRVHQWYKNLVIYLPLIFVGLALNLESWFYVSLGFVSLCLVSSSNYIVNDIFDIKKDRVHPEKKRRPLASGKISIFSSICISLFLLFSGITIGFFISEIFSLLLGIFFLSTLSYSLYFKKEVFIDLLMVSSNFVIRAISGAFILGVIISPWLILCTFFLSLFLISGKRHSNILFLGNRASKYKSVLKYYNKELTSHILLLSTAFLTFSYALYTFQSLYPGLIYTIPIAVYVIFRYLYFVNIGHKIARNPHFFISDFRLLLGIFFWITLTGFIIYF
jgi:4-hydroxybenzoate polyprenyltransferase